MDELPKWSHLFTFCVRASGKVCRVIVPKLAGSDFELSLKVAGPEGPGGVVVSGIKR